MSEFLEHMSTDELPKILTNEDMRKWSEKKWQKKVRRIKRDIKKHEKYIKYLHKIINKKDKEKSFLKRTIKKYEEYIRTKWHVSGEISYSR